MDRLAMLRQMVESRPDDPFALYGLAMELVKQEHDEAVQAFATLVERHASYVPTYLMFGNLLAQMGQRERAIAIYDRGIEVAGAAGDDHAQSELQAARAQL
jgi:tetratricopeptide (TPR) repeat protein